MGIRPATWEEEARHWKELFNDLEKRWSIAEQARVELLKEKNRLNDALKGAADVANISGQEIKDLKRIQYELSAELVNKNKNIEHLLEENARLQDALEFYEDEKIQLQKEIERLQTIEQAYDALRKSL